MAGFSNITGQESIVFANNASYDGTERGGRMTTNGQLWIGSTASPHVRLGTLTSTGGTITITPGAGTINFEASAATPLSFPCDSGTATPAANTLTVSGQLAGTIPAVFTIGAGSTIDVEDRTWTTSLVVDPSATVGLRGTFQTITAALAAATAGQTIFIRPGTYTENITMVAGVNLAAYEASGFNENTKINGQISCSYSGTCSISGLCLTNASADCVVISGVAATFLKIVDCFILAPSGGGGPFFFMSGGSTNSYIQIDHCMGEVGLNSAYFNINTNRFLKVVNSYLDNFSGINQNSAITNSSGATYNFYIANSTIVNKFAFNNVHALFENSNVGQSNNAGTGVALVGSNLDANQCHIFTSGGPAVSIDATSAFNSTLCTLRADTTGGNTTLVTNAGTFVYDVVGQSGTGTLTLPAPTSEKIAHIDSSNIHGGQVVHITTPGAYPYTTLTTDYVILVDTSAARTITPMASPVTGQMYVIKDNVGSAAANNITVTPSGKNIDGAASTTINVNFGSITIVYNGTQWNII